MTVRISPVVAMSWSSQSITASACSAIPTSATPATLFKASGNVGMLDIVAALAWVRDNIANFGGDPGRVLVFGESGGGQKVSTLLAMPPAKGLFNRAVIESGPGVKMNSLDYATKVGDMVLAELGIKPDSVTDIQSLSLDRIMAAQGAVNRKLGGFIPGMIAGFSPVVDGVSLPQNPFDPVAPEVSADVPVLIGFNRTELTLFAAGDPTAFTLDEAGLHKRIQSLLGDRAEAAIQGVPQRLPERKSLGTVLPDRQRLSHGSVHRQNRRTSRRPRQSAHVRLRIYLGDADP